MRDQRVNLGGERLGAGSMMEVTLSAAGRSRHNLSRIWRSSATTGTLIPFLTEVILPGDEMRCHVEAKIRTQPTVGPLFGFFETKIELFKVPMRYYMAPLHNNFVDVGDEMDDVKIPQMRLRFQEQSQPAEDRITDATTAHLSQVAQDSLMAYLGVRALGTPVAYSQGGIVRDFNALPMLMMADIYKQYYANQQTGVGAIMAESAVTDESIEITSAQVWQNTNWVRRMEAQWWGPPSATEAMRIYENYEIQILALGSFTNVESFVMKFDIGATGNVDEVEIWRADGTVDRSLWGNIGLREVVRESAGSIRLKFGAADEFDFGTNQIYAVSWYGSVPNEPNMTWTITPLAATKSNYATFDLKQIDRMRMAILRYSGQPAAQIVNEIQGIGDARPYSEMWGHEIGPDGVVRGTYKSRMNGLFIRGYKSDRFQNWLNSDWVSGVTTSSAVDVSDGVLTMDALNLAQRVYELLNRTIAAGNTYASWLKARWNVERLTQVEMPMYIGGASGTIGFDEVVSTAETGTTEAQTGNPLGTLAGRGVADGVRGESVITISEDEEPSFLIGLFSLVPQIDYAQGNKWWTRLQTLEELHIPQFDGIGFQDLLTDEFLAIDTTVAPTAAPATGLPGAISYHAIGKQPAWLQYQTAVNEIYGTFAYPDESMFMTLVRLYQGDIIEGIDDFNPYINPAAYLQAFATHNRVDQPFWVQIGITLHADRMMSATAIPNL